MIDLKNKNALITGAGAGIGAAIALQLAQAGCRLTLCGRSQDKLQAQAEALRAQVPDVAVLIAPDGLGALGCGRVGARCMSLYVTAGITAACCGRGAMPALGRPVRNVQNRPPGELDEKFETGLAAVAVAPGHIVRRRGCDADGSRRLWSQGKDRRAAARARRRAGVERGSSADLCRLRHRLQQPQPGPGHVRRRPVRRADVIAAS